MISNLFRKTISIIIIFMLILSFCSVALAEEEGLRWADGTADQERWYTYEETLNPGDAITAPLAENDSGDEITYTWYDSSGLEVGTDIELTLIHGGQYQCRITDGSGNWLYYYVNVRLTNGLRWTDGAEGNNKEDTYSNISPGDSIVVPGVESGYGEITYTWYDDNWETVGNESSLTVNVGGDYRCDITDGSGSWLYYYAHVRFETGLRWADGTADQERWYTYEEALNPGDTITAPLAENDSGDEITYTWYDYYGQEVGTNIELTLIHGGQYRCRITDGSGNWLLYYADVRLINGLRWTDGAEGNNKEDTYSNISPGDSIVVPGVESGYGEITYTWYDDNWETVGNESSLTVNVGGDYRCDITDGSGSWLYYYAHVRFETGLRWADGTADQERWYTYEEALNPGDTITAPLAENDSGDEITYTWYNNNLEECGSDIELTIHNGGNYTCRISDGSGNRLEYSARVRFPSGLRWADGDKWESKTETIYIGQEGFIDIIAPTAINRDSVAYPIQYTWYEVYSHDIIVESPSMSVDNIGYFLCEITDGSGNCLYYYVDVKFASGLKWADGDDSESKNDVYQLNSEGYAEVTVPKVVNDGNDDYVITYTWKDEYGEEIGYGSTVRLESVGNYTCWITDGSGSWLYYYVAVNNNSGLRWKDDTEGTRKEETLYINPGETIKLNAEAINNNNIDYPIVYGWIVDDDWSIIDDSTPTITVSEPGHYRCEISDGSGNWLIYSADIIAVKRVYGSTRYQTAMLQADQLKDTLGVDRFDSIIVATGENYADALSGAYLGFVKDAPIILARNDQNTISEVKDYISLNLKDGGTVYLLGGPTVVPGGVTEGLNVKVKRLYGSTRYETNLEILKEAGVTNEEIMVCDGTNFADSLSASAAGRPILLVDRSLKPVQSAYLDKLGTSQFYLIGGTGVLPVALENTIKKYGNVKRLGGQDRFETSIKVAEEFFEDSDRAVLAYSHNYPDGLCGGTLAAYNYAPLLLVRNDPNNVNTIKEFTTKAGIKSGIVLGGPTLVSDASVRSIFDMKSQEDIHVYPPHID